MNDDLRQVDNDEFLAWINVLLGKPVVHTCEGLLILAAECKRRGFDTAENTLLLAAGDKMSAFADDQEWKP